MEEFTAKSNILIEFRYMDNDFNLLHRGRIAKIITNVDKILMTELLFSGHLKNISNEELLALFSILLS